jgi:tRNA A37 threonylcarbamoyladenosine modification protein TsaB
MYKLHLKTSKISEKEILLFKDNELLDELKGDFEVVSSIKKILEKNGLTPKDIDEFSYDKGPGSYTGLKIGSSVINTLNWVFGKKNIKELVLPEYGSEPNITSPKKPQTLK